MINLTVSFHLPTKQSIENGNKAIFNKQFVRGYDLFIAYIMEISIMIALNIDQEIIFS
jgi:hypothetical protein